MVLADFGTDRLLQKTSLGQNAPTASQPLLVRSDPIHRCISLFVVTRFLGYLRDNRMNTVTTSKNALKLSRTDYCAKSSAVQFGVYFL